MHIPKRRIEALESAPSIIPSMIERALEAGVSATYVLMDTWFTQQPLIQNETQEPPHVPSLPIKNDLPPNCKLTDHFNKKCKLYMY